MVNKNLLKQAQQLQAKLAKAQEELKGMSVEATSGGGVVKVVVSCDQQIRSVKISQEAAGDAEMLEDLVKAAINEGLDKSREMANAHLSKLTGGLGIPGF